MYLRSFQPARRRCRWLYLLWIALIIPAGLASRRFSYLLPAILKKNAGDILWAVMAYLVIAFAQPKARVRTVAAVSLLLSYAVELSKLAPIPLLDPFRHTRIGALLFGTTFSWSNIVCYTIGIVAVAGIE